MAEPSARTRRLLALRDQAEALYEALGAEANREHGLPETYRAPDTFATLAGLRGRAAEIAGLLAQMADHSAWEDAGRPPVRPALRRSRRV